MYIEKNKAVVNVTGNPGLATAGTGDILSGILASFLSSGLNSFDAATVGAFVQGKSSDELLSSKGYKRSDCFRSFRNYSFCYF